MRERSAAAPGRGIEVGTDVAIGIGIAIRSAAAALLVAGALLLPGASRAEDPEPAPAPRASLFKGEDLSATMRDGFARGFDAVLIRPLGALKTGAGFALFVPAAALSVMEGRDATKEGWDILVAEPARQTFERPLGDF